jgi:hypothetical protein
MEEIRNCNGCEYRKVKLGTSDVCIFPGYEMLLEDLSQPCPFGLLKDEFCNDCISQGSGDEVRTDMLRRMGIIY